MAARASWPGIPPERVRGVDAARAVVRADRARHERRGSRSTGSPTTTAPSASGCWARTAGCASRSCATRGGGCGRRWQSKLLLREPRFVDAFGGRPWFPRVPGRRPRTSSTTSAAFVAALPGGDAEDVHWAVQHDLVAQLPLDHVGRVERIAETVAALRAHARARRRPAATRRENASPLPLPPHAYDDGGRARSCATATRADFEAFGYAAPRPPAATPREWEARVEPLLPLLRATIDEHARVGQLHRLAQRRGGSACARSSAGSSASHAAGGRARSPVLANLEEPRTTSPSAGRGPRRPPRRASPPSCGSSDEARSLPWVLPPLLRAVEPRRALDNGSTDGTRRRRPARRGRGGRGRPPRGPRLPVRDRALRRRSTSAPRPTRSTASRYFYNWSFSHVAHGLRAQVGRRHGAHRRRRGGAARPRLAARGGRGGRARCRGYPLYVADDRRAFLDTALRNCEPWAWPNRPGYSFVKALEWELPMFPPSVRDGRRCRTSAAWSSSTSTPTSSRHWSPTDFAASPRTRAQAARVGGVRRARRRRRSRRRASWRSRRPRACT